MDIGELPGHAEDKLAELLAPIALPTAEVVDILDNLSSVATALAMVASAGVPQVDHAVLGEAAEKPGDVQDAALRRVVGVQDDCFIVVRHLALLIRCVGASRLASRVTSR